MPIIIVLALLLALFAGPVGARAATTHASYSAKIQAAKKHAQQARNSLRWISSHMHSYKNAKQYHSIIEKHRGRYFHWRAQLDKYLKLAHDAYLRTIPPHKSAWDCIHRYEGSWTDSGAPYYGGLQMDWSFMHAYGGWLLAHRGTADHWTPLEQMWVAERALRAGRGFYPWPQTAHRCGLI